jgi:hypothetical protein
MINEMDALIDNDLYKIGFVNDDIIIRITIFLKISK